MIRFDARMIRAVAVFVGSVVGGGVFALPYVFAQAGYGVGLLMLCVLALMMGGMLFMYADVVAHTPGNHRFAGHVGAHLGPRWGRAAAVSLAFGFWGAMLAYLVVGGRLLASLAGTESALAETLFGLCVAAVVGALSYRGLRFVSRLEVWMLGILLFLFAFMVLASLSRADLSNVHVVGSMGGVLPLYGVVFFALTGGIGAMPEMRAILGSRGSLPYATFLGLGLVVGMYALFTFAVVAATGTHTSEFAIDALVPRLGDSFRVIGMSLALVCVLSIYLIGSVELQNGLRYDSRMGRVGAWALGIGVPVALYLAGVRSFIGILEFVGATTAGINGVLVALTYERMRSGLVGRKHACIEIPRPVTFALVGLYLAGISATLISFFAL